jgi:hypothetical protein
VFDGAEPLATAADGQVTIPQAAHRAFCMSEDIVRLVLDRKLKRKWRIASERGYTSLLLDLDEVRALVRGPDHGGLTGIAISDRWMDERISVTGHSRRFGRASTISGPPPLKADMRTGVDLRCGWADMSLLR